MGKSPLLALPIEANWKLVGAEQMGALARWGDAGMLRGWDARIR